MGDAQKTLDLHISIEGSEPEIWRDLRVPAWVPLPHLHRAIQAAFGWKGFHLHVFEAFADSARRSFSSPDFAAESDQVEPEADFTLAEILPLATDALLYEYDFGDSWIHAITVTGHALAPAGQLSCLGGAGRGPVEDSGGVGGYAELAAVLTDPNHPEYFETAGWYMEVTGESASSFDPDAFDADAVTDRLATLSLGLGNEPASAEEMTAVVRPVHWLLDRVGADGLELTKDGYLKPAVVRQVMAELGWQSQWIGKFNRESQTMPVLGLREQTQRWRLLRKYRGRLVRTPAGRKLDGDVPALWDYLAEVMAHPGTAAEEYVHMVCVRWLLDGTGPPWTVRGEVIAAGLSARGFMLPGNTAISGEVGDALHRDFRRATRALQLMPPEHAPMSGPRLTPAGAKFLFEVQKRQAQQPARP